MAQAFAVASVSFIVNFSVTVIVSLMTAPKPDAELRGLVYSLTEKPSTAGLPWYRRASSLGLLLVILTLLLNWIFY